MFNYNAEQIFVVQPRSAGGDILAFLLSLDNTTASLDFKKIAYKDKLATWSDFVNQTPDNAHVVGHVNISHSGHFRNIDSADFCQRYIHKNHFYELEGLCSKNADVLESMLGPKKSIGIYLTDNCVSKILEFRPYTPNIDFYQKWVYANQKKLLKEFFNIDSLHFFSFAEMLDIDLFLDHLKYCKDLLSLDLDLDQTKLIILQWYEILKSSN